MSELSPKYLAAEYFVFFGSATSVLKTAINNQIAILHEETSKRAALVRDSGPFVDNTEECEGDVRTMMVGVTNAYIEPESRQSSA